MITSKAYEKTDPGSFYSDIDYSENWRIFQPAGREMVGETRDAENVMYAQIYIIWKLVQTVKLNW